MKNEHNGLLVENYNKNALADGMNRLIFDKELYTKCKQNAQSSVSELSIHEIAKKWDSLLRKYDE